MRVLVVVHAFPPQARGGAEIYAEQHARAVARLFGDEVHVLAREQRPELAEFAVRTEHRDGLTITWVNNTFRDIRSYEDSYRSAPIARIAASLIDQFGPDAAHVHHLTCLSTEIPRLLASRGVPVIFTLHDYWLLCHRGQLLDTHYRQCAGPEPSGCRNCLGVASAPIPHALVPGVRALDARLPQAVASSARNLGARFFGSELRKDPASRRRLEHMRTVCDEVTRFLAPSRSIRDRFITFGIAPERIELSAYGFDRALFPPQKSPPVARAGEQPPLRIGFLGTLMVSKAPHVLLEAFRQLPPGSASVDLLGAEADYHGDASYRQVLAPLLSLPGVRARGSQTPEDVAHALSSLDVLVVTSIWPETSPLVIREAFMTGLPVIASNIGGIPELVEHERNGLLFEPGDVNGLRRELSRLIEEPGLIERLRTGVANTRVRSLDEDVVATRRLYEACASASPRRMRKRLAAVVLNFQTSADTTIAVSSLLASNRPPDEIIVVDNDTGGECREALARWGDAVTYLPTGRNLGFSGGMNVGIRRSLDHGADLVLLTNSDVVVPPDCLTRLEVSIAPGSNVGIAGPLVMLRTAPDLVGSGGIDYNLRTGRMRHRAFGARADAATEWADSEVDAVSGCLMLVAREVFDRIGLLDGRYFFGFEEIDFCLRARAAGFVTRLAGHSVVYHEGSKAIGHQSPRRFYFAARNHLMLAWEHPGRDNRIARGARGLFVAALNLAYAAKAPGSSLSRRVSATLRGIRDHLRGRYGGDSSSDRT